MENKKDDLLVIDLEGCMNARSFRSDKIIHQAEFKKCTRLIDNQIEHLPKNEDNSNSENIIRTRYNDTITILGTRGSGKTSFLMSVLNHYKDSRDVEILNIVDPTLIEEKGHIFLTLISLIKDKVEDKINKNECNPCCKEYQTRSCWENKLKQLAAGLPSIDINNDSLYSNWHDPEHVMKKGLESVKAAKELEENFEKVTKFALDVLGKKVFMIAFDDIDVNFRKGWQVLETIRKYLTSPYIITLLCGDLKLFSKGIRKNQWDNFGNKLLTYEGEKLGRLEVFDQMVTEIESQYMQKIMKTPNRIHLLTIGELINTKNVYLAINNEKHNIYEHYVTLLKDWGINNKYEAHTIVSYLLSLPLRTQIQFLKQYDDCKEKTNLMNIVDAFVSDMYELGIDVEQAKSQNKDLCNIIHEFLIKEGLLNETYQLQPTSSVAKYNATLFSLNTMFIEHSKNNPYMFFEYWITIATIRNLLTIMPYRNELKKEASLLPTIEGLAEYSFIGQNKVFRDICCHLSTYIRATLNKKIGKTKIPWGGTLVLEKFNIIVRRDNDIIIDKAFWEQPLITRQLMFLPMSTASFSYKQQPLVIFSFYTLLGTITEILKRFNLIKNTNKQEAIRQISGFLNELSQVKDYAIPTFDETIENQSDDEDTNNNIDEEVIEENETLANLLYIWMKKNPTCISPHLIGKIATRAFYAMRKLDDRVYDKNNHNLGDAMHRRIVIVLNSAIVEDAKENLETFTLSNNNPIADDHIFIENMDKIKSLSEYDKQNLKFSHWLLSCPLFLLYLNLQDEELGINTIGIKNFIINNNKRSIFNSAIYDNAFPIYGKNSFEWFKNNSIYKELKKVSVWSKKPKTNAKK